MDAAGLIEEFKQLSHEEQRKVVAYINQVQAVGEVGGEFRRIADEVFKTNDELFRKLAE